MPTPKPTLYMTHPLLSQLTPIFRKIFSEPDLELTLTLTANDVAKWDSLTHLTLINEIEKQFNLKFKLRELTSLKNVGDLVQLIESKLNP